MTPPTTATDAQPSSVIPQPSAAPALVASLSSISKRKSRSPFGRRSVHCRPFVALLDSARLALTRTPWRRTTRATPSLALTTFPSNNSSTLSAGTHAVCRNLEDGSIPRLSTKTADCTTSHVVETVDSCPVPTARAVSNPPCLLFAPSSLSPSLSSISPTCRALTRYHSLSFVLALFHHPPFSRRPVAIGLGTAVQYARSRLRIECLSPPSSRVSFMLLSPVWGAFLLIVSPRSPAIQISFRAGRPRPADCRRTSRVSCHYRNAFMFGFRERILLRVPCATSHSRIQRLVFTPLQSYAAYMLHEPRPSVARTKFGPRRVQV